MRFLLLILSAVIACSAKSSAAPVPRVSVEVAPDRSIQRVGFFDWLLGGQDSRPPPPMPPRDERKRPAPEVPRTSNGETYRTLCVRLCDGFYFPMSFATTRGKLEDDAGRCERQCPSNGRLFTHRNPGQSVDDMVDLSGNPYTKLPTAFRFRAEFVTDCTCRGNPWDAESVARHQSYPPA
jgi:hypothetical protein